jgi:hypothetical protein
MLTNYVLESTGDTTDRTQEIEAILEEKGACVLGTGVFYVSGVTMPNHSTLMGFGDASQLILREEIESGFAVKLGSRCMVKDLAVKGSENDLSRPTEVGTRHGILYEGTATPKDWYGQPRSCIIQACQIRSFSGGGITCVDTGYSSSCSIVASDCHINFCGAGINISHFSEYHRFSNMHCTGNFYGCINNGGNNVFTACAFDSNFEGYLIDNTDGKSNNNSHGSLTACTFNHNNSNKGIGIHVIGAKHGYVFTACQVFYSKIVLEDAKGMQFHDFNFGKNSHIIVKGGAMTLFTDSIFAAEPIVEIEDNPHVRFTNCYLRSGEEWNV